MNAEMKHPKFGIPVRIAMSNNTQIIGLVFVRQNQRIIDVLCDARQYFPVETIGGVRLLNKQHAMQIDLMPIEEMLEMDDLLPGVDFQYLRNNIW